MKKCLFVIMALFVLVNLNAQTVQKPSPEFEVSASLYPWDVHDEGIELMLDNLTSMAGVNSVYLISVMHEEHRPFLGPKDTGPWHYIHNPAREEWYAEDARAYFHPKTDLYGKLKPYASSHSWLSETDWLKVVVDAARARGLKVGAEVSHTYLPWNELFESHPEYQQRDIRNRPVYGPCPNNPDIREYLLALYGDIAANYDIDFVQTCMYIFQGTAPRDGTCFCEHCQKEAKSMGFDLTAAMQILMDNPYAHPELDQWQNFRRASTTKIYKLIVERMRQGNPDIDFRINDLNNRYTGLFLEDLKGFITSVHMSTHTEQNGYELTDRKSRILTTRYFMGPETPIIPGIPVRILTNPNIVKSSVKISVINGSQGIALKHYDGATYSHLRAIRDGLAAAGVKGFTPHVGFEAEKMTLSGYAPDSCLQERCIKTSGTGTAKSQFTEATGVYDIIVSYVDEKEGQSTVNLAVGGKQRASWKLTEDVGCWRRKTIPAVRIRNGDEVKITGITNGKEQARLDYIEFVKK